MNIGLCLSDPRPQPFGDGSARRAASAVHFAGHYRLIDFMLSNMVNSGIYTVAMVLGSQYQTLLSHIGSGREWDLALSGGGIRFFPPYPGGERPYDELLDEPLQRAIIFIEETKTDNVLVTDGSVVCNIDYRDALEFHKAQGADVTALYVRKSLQEQDRPQTVAYKINRDGRVNGIVFEPPAGDRANIDLGTYIVKKTVLLRLLSGERSCDVAKFSCSLLAGALKSLKVMSWRHDGYTARIRSLDTFFRYNTDMLDPRKRDPLFDCGGRRIHTKVYDSTPTKYGEDADIHNSIVSNGCVIEGKVENSVIFRNVHVRAGAVVRNCILMRNTVVGANAELHWIVTDQSVIITENRRLLGYKTNPVYIAKGKIV
ncbi:MAG: glucose-1-phosphate adenylyltransferase subunit GlgD [Oscillospiraceae bacterium]|nr:glucose-1-phosphate adenylyltransferase subunit GlgD [Oscillospiraceae bacterium]